MSKPRLKTPTYRRRKARNTAVVTLTDARTGRRRDYYLGEHDSSESRELYHRLIAQWEADRRHLPHPPMESARRSGGLTVACLVLAYWKHVQNYHSASEAASIRCAIRVARKLFGSESAESFGPNRLRTVREEMIRMGWVRTSINRQVHRVCAMFQWAASHEMLPERIYRQLKTIQPLRRGKTDARESDPIGPVPEHRIEAVRPHVSQQVWALIQLQLLTGARGGELFPMRPIDLDMTAEVWRYRPQAHKTAHHGHTRTILIGPKAQAIISPLLAGRPVDKPLFSPQDAEVDRREKQHAARKTPLSCGNRPGTNRRADPQRRAADRYTKDSYCRAIQRACDRAFTPPEHLARIKVKRGKSTRLETPAEWKKRLGTDRWEELKVMRKDHRWHPHQLRHNAGTNIRRDFGLEASRLILGHRSQAVTEIYAEQDMDNARRIIGKVG